MPVACLAGVGCPHKMWDPGAAYIHGQRIAQWRNAKVDRPVPALHAPVDSPVYHAHGAEIFPDSDTARCASHVCACTAVTSSCSGDAYKSISNHAVQLAYSHSCILFKNWIQESRMRGCCRRFCAHPGELVAARTFCTAAQERLLRSVCNLSARLPKYIRIAASVHTDIDMFIFIFFFLFVGEGFSTPKVYEGNTF